MTTKEQKELDKKRLENLERARQAKADRKKHRSRNARYIEAVKAIGKEAFPSCREVTVTLSESGWIAEVWEGTKAKVYLVDDEALDKKVAELRA